MKCKAPWLKAAKGTEEFTMVGGIGMWRARNAGEIILLRKPSKNLKSGFAW